MCGFCGSFSKIFPLTPASCDKKFLKQFLLHCTSVCMSSKRMLQSFKILFQTEDINIYVLRGVYFSRYVQLNIWLSDENASAMKYETGFSREAIKNSRGRVLKENSVIGRS